VYGLDATSDYTGACGAELALEELRNAALADGEDIGKDMYSLRGGDIAVEAQALVHQYRGHMRPRCYFGNMLDRMPPKLDKLVRDAVADTEKTNQQLLQGGLNGKDAAAETSRRLVNRVATGAKELAASMSTECKADCLLHGDKCPVFPVPGPVCYRVAENLILSGTGRNVLANWLFVEGMQIASNTVAHI